MAGESLLTGFPNIFRMLYDALSPASTPAPKKKTAPTLTPTQRKQAIQQAAQQTVAQERSRPSAIPLPVRDTSAAILSGINSGTYGLPVWIASKLTGSPNDLWQAYMDQEGQRSPLVNVLSTLGEGLATGSTEAKAIGAGGELLGAVAPRLGKVVQAATELKKGQKLANTARIVGAGTVSGAADAAIRGRDVGQGAEVGAVAAPVAHLALTGGDAAFRKARDLLGYAPVSEILTKYIKTPIADIQAAMDARAKQGLPSSVYEVLPQADRESLQDAVRKMPAGVRERLNTALSQRAQQIVGETASQVGNLTEGSVRPIREKLASDLATSRGADTPTDEELQLADAATKSKLGLNRLRKQESRNIMSDYDDKVAYGSVDDLLSSKLPEGYSATNPITGEEGPSPLAPLDPAAAAQIKAKGRGLNLSDSGVTVRQVTRLRKALKKEVDNGGVNADAAQEAINHIDAKMAQDHPDASRAMQRMREAYAGKKRMGEGYQEGLKGNTQDVSNLPDQKLENVYGTPEGAQGRTLGQAKALATGVLTDPEKSFGTLKSIELDPSTQRAISENLGGNAGSDIADLARTQTKSIRNLGGVNPNRGDEHDVEQTLQNLVMAALPQTMTHTKAIAVSRLFKAMRIPEKQGSQIVDMLFSTDPKNIARGVGILRQAGEPGEQVLRSIAQDLAVGTTAANTYQNAVAPYDEPAASEQAPAAPDYSKMSDEDLLKEIGQQPQDYSKMSDADLLKEIGQQPQAQASPYAGQTDNYSPEFQQLFHRVLEQESNHSQMDTEGNPLQSPVGAVGIAQVMPSTAPKAAKLAGLPWDEHAYYTDPEYNKALGAAYLNDLLKMFNGNPALAVAAYNAGPGRVKRAIVKGQSRWFDYLPDETKQYLQAILS